MKEVSVADFEKDFDSYMDRIEAGEQFLIRQPDGRAVVAVPAKELEPLTEHMSDDEWYNLYSNHEEAS
jgi:antitoxin (DNA-binding transcriptional repressor) of toxin-antitoxin stability system